MAGKFLEDISNIIREYFLANPQSLAAWNKDEAIPFRRHNSSTTKSLTQIISGENSVLNEAYPTGALSTQATKTDE